MEYEIENKKTKIKDTEAFWKGSGEKEIYAGKEAVIADTVSLRNLEPGQQYTLKGTLADPETGKILEENGRPAASRPAALPNRRQHTKGEIVAWI